MNKKIIFFVLVASLFVFFLFTNATLADSTNTTNQTNSTNQSMYAYTTRSSYYVNDMVDLYTHLPTDMNCNLIIVDPMGVEGYPNYGLCLKDGISFSYRIGGLDQSGQWKEKVVVWNSSTPDVKYTLYTPSFILTVPVCNDTDGGINYTVKGTATGIAFLTNVTVNLTDYCLNNSTLKEAYCDGSNAYWSASTYICPGMCLNGACINQSVNATCTDSDSGKNYYVKGTVTKGSASSTDCCAINGYDSTCTSSSFFLAEKYCDSSGNINIEDINCSTVLSNGYCKDGVCANQPYCYDSDGGTNYYVKGYVDSSMAPGKAWDTCINSTLLGEYQCNPYVQGANLGTNYNCTYGCLDGACLPSPQNATCTDSDGGKNYYVYGLTTGVYGGINGFTDDYCTSNNATDIYGNPINLVEFYCVDNYNYNATGYYCPNGCANGVCIPYVNNNVTGKCVNHDECSQACDNLSISSHWMGSKSYRKTWEGTCPSSVYGCMTGDCCLGQCNSEGNCWCMRTNAVDIYGNVCPTGSTCGNDCSCHPTGGGYNFYVKTDKYSYSPEDNMRITAVLSGNSSMDFSRALVTATIGNTNVEMNSVGTGSSTCASSATGTTCSIATEYYFVGNYSIPSDMTSGVYKIISTAVVNGDREDTTANFRVGNNYSDYVDVSISPHEQNTIIGNEVDYYVTIIDKHPAMVCPTSNLVGNCSSQNYDYLIEVEGLPYHAVFPSNVDVYAGGFKTFELKVFPSSVKTSEGIATTVQQATATTATTERSVGITGKAVATQTGASETVPVQEAVFKFAVKASLKEDKTTSHSDIGILHVKFVQMSQPTPFPATEKMDVELRKGWNLVSLPGKGLGFTQGSCSADQKPIAFVYIPDKQRYTSFEEATSTMGSEGLLNHLSTHSFWVYSYEDCNIGFNVGGYSTYSGLAVDSGWSLLGITKDMVGETLSNIKGDCVFEKIYNWDSSSQKWTEMSENDLIENMGYGIAVKTSATCAFKANFIQPPTFPGG